MLTPHQHEHSVCKMPCLLAFTFLGYHVTWGDPSQPARRNKDTLLPWTSARSLL